MGHNGLRALPSFRASRRTSFRIPQRVLPEEPKAEQPFPSNHGRSEILERVAAPVGSLLRPPRLLVVLAHPDDEVIALGGRMERLAASRLITVTDGAPEDGADARDHGFASLNAYREARKREAMGALADAGLPADVVLPFAHRVPDQRASLHMEELARAIAKEIEDFSPEAVLTHPYEGGHPDHDACAFAAHKAVRLIAGGRRHSFIPVLVEAPFYHAGDDGSMVTGKFLFEEESLPLRVCDLSAQEAARKQARLRCFQSQAATLAQFGTAREMFRIAPDYDFLQPPHRGPLLYEQFPWGMRGGRFCGLAADAMKRLFVQEDQVHGEPLRRTAAR